MKNEWYEPVEKDILNYFWALFYADIIEALQNDPMRANSRSALLSAIRSGRIRYENGLFSGSFNISISRELSKFAKYDGRTKTWKGIAPPDVAAAASVSNTRLKNLYDNINILISEIPAKVEDALGKMSFSIQAPTLQMNRQADKDLRNIGIDQNITPELSKRLFDDYTTNQNLNIKNWEPDQVLRLRDAIETAATKGYNRIELQEMIMSEWGVSQRKAKFLARQETSLYMAKLRDARYQDAGVEKFMWMATGGKAGDGRTRDLHRFLHGKVFTYGNPPVIDQRTGERGYPGEAFGCRCVAKPII